MFCTCRGGVHDGHVTMQVPQQRRSLRDELCTCTLQTYSESLVVLVVGIGGSVSLWQFCAGTVFGSTLAMSSSEIWKAWGTGRTDALHTAKSCFGAIFAVTLLSVIDEHASR